MDVVPAGSLPTRCIGGPLGSGALVNQPADVDATLGKLRWKAISRRVVFTILCQDVVDFWGSQAARPLISLTFIRSKMRRGRAYGTSEICSTSSRRVTPADEP